MGKGQVRDGLWRGCGGGRDGKGKGEVRDR